MCQECNANCHTECGLKRTIDREVIKECFCIMVDLHVHMNGFNSREMVEMYIAKMMK